MGIDVICSVNFNPRTPGGFDYTAPSPMTRNYANEQAIRTFTYLFYFRQSYFFITKMKDTKITNLWLV